MAYDRYDARDDRSRWQDSDRDFRSRERGGPSRGERGFFERAGDEIASWFGGDEDRHRDDHRPRGDWERDEERARHGRDRDFGDDRFDRDERGAWGSRGYRGHGGGGGGGLSRRGNQGDFNSPGLEGRSQPMFGGYTAAESMSTRDRFSNAETGRRNWDDQWRRSDSSAHHDRHYQDWRKRQIDDLDRDYDEYRREHQSKFESDFGSWRERRMQKRGLLGQIREHMEVVGKDDQHVGTVDRVAGDRLILAKSDPDSGGVHHSLSCADVERIDGDRVVLDCSAEDAKQRWRDDSRSRALFEREDQGEMGDRALNRSFSGTYR